MKQKPVKGSDYWATPASVFGPLDSEFNFEWDACANAENTKVPGCYFDEKQNALLQDWSRTAQTVWLNPPYSDVTPWLAKAAEQRAKGVTTVALLKADHSTGWWKKYVFNYDQMKPRPGVEIRDWPWRIKFVVPKGWRDKKGRLVTSVTPPWPNVVVIFRGQKCSARS